MSAMNMQQDARVCGQDGEVGRLKHLIVSDDTREVTDLVVEAHGHEYVLPVSVVTEANGDSIEVTGTRADLCVARFDHDDYHTVDDERLRRESTGEALHGGAPLLDAAGNAVEVGTGMAGTRAERIAVVTHGPDDFQLRARRAYATPTPGDGVETAPLTDGQTAPARYTEPVRETPRAVDDGTSYRPEGPLPVDEPLERPTPR